MKCPLRSSIAREMRDQNYFIVTYLILNKVLVDQERFVVQQVLQRGQKKVNVDFSIE